MGDGGWRSTLSRSVARGLLIVALGALGAYVVWTVKRATDLYAYLKDSGRGWTNPVFRSDDELGLAPIANAAGGEIVPLGPPVPTRFDEQGFRVPEGQFLVEHGRPLVLALGCSFTYGAACPAEAAFPAVVARELGGSELNAGVPGYGLAQMLILARRLIPRHAPDYVLVQYSDWLVSRAQTGYAPSFFGVLPTPFFVPDATGTRLQPPVFRGWELDLPLTRFRNPPRSAAEYFEFLVRAGLPLLVHDDVSLALVAAQRSLGILPDRAADADAITQAVYSEIGALCRAQRAQMLIVLLGPPPSPRRLEELKKAGAVVDAELALCRGVDDACPYHFPAVSAAYRAAYGHFRGSPPVFVDPHPNARAHRVIADEVVAAVRAQRSMRRGS